MNTFLMSPNIQGVIWRALINQLQFWRFVCSGLGQNKA
jgi:hypothetical protein